MYWIACARATLGNRERALAALERSVAVPSLAWLPLLQDSACLLELRNDPRYQAAMHSLQARHQQLRQQLPETLARHGLTGTSS